MKNISSDKKGPKSEASLTQKNDGAGAGPD